MKETVERSKYFRRNVTPRYYDSHFINEEHSARHSRLPHIHDDFLELFYVYDGSGKYMVDNVYYDIRKGDIVLCNAGVLHGESAYDASRRVRSYSVAVKNVCFLGLPDNHICPKDAVPVLHTGLLHQSIGELFHLIYVLSSDRKYLDEACDSLTLGLLLMTYELLMSRERQNLQKSGDSVFELGRRILEYLDQNYNRDITMQKISADLHMSESYIAHVFKNQYGIPPAKYIMNRRMGEAQGLLMDTETSIGEIADQLGFSSVAHFNSVFKKYVGIPPGAYRKSFQKMEE